MTMVDEVWGKCINKNLSILIKNKKILFEKLKQTRKELKNAMDSKNPNTDSLITEELKVRKKYEQCVKRINLLQAKNFDYSMLTNQTLSEYGFNVTALKGVIDVETYYGPAKKNVLKLQSELIDEFKEMIKELYRRKDAGIIGDEDLKEVQNELFYTYAHYIKTCPLYRTQDYVKVEEMEQEVDDDIIIPAQEPEKVISKVDSDNGSIREIKKEKVESLKEEKSLVKEEKTITLDMQNAIDKATKEISDKIEFIKKIQEDKEKNIEKLQKLDTNITNFDDYYKGNAQGKQESKIKLEMECQKLKIMISANDYAINYANLTIDRDKLLVVHNSLDMNDQDYALREQLIDSKDELISNQYEVLSCNQRLEYLKLKALLLNEQVKLGKISPELKEKQDEDLMDEINSNGSELRVAENKMLETKKKKIEKQLLDSYSSGTIDKTTLDHDLSVLTTLKNIDETTLDNFLVFNQEQDQNSKTL